MSNQPGSAIWKIYKDITESLPHQRDPRVLSASRRFLKAFQMDIYNSTIDQSTATESPNRGKKILNSREK